MNICRPQPNQVQISESIDKTFFSLMIIPLGCVSSFNAAGNNNQPSSSLKRRGETSSSGFFSRLPFSLRSLSSGGRDASSNSVSLSRTFLSGHQSQKSEVESNADGSTAVSDLKKNAGDENTAATQPIQLDLQQVDFALYVIENAGAAAPLLIPSSDPLTGRRNSVEDQEGDASTNTPSFMQMFQPNSSFRVSVLGEDGAADTQSNEVAYTKPTSTESSAGNIAANCAEQVICTSNGNLYSMNEIYGMKQKPLPQRVPLPPSDVTVVKKGAVKGEYEKVGAMTDLEDETGDPVDGTPRSKRTTSGDVEEVAKEEVKKDAAADEGDSSLDDDCVVCLTNPKTTFLIPCRHMCVCSDCLKQVDKCPVCRTPFDEYIEVNALSTYLYAPVCR